MNNINASLSKFLHQVGFSAKLTEDEMQRVANAVDVVTIAPSEMLFSEGDRGESLYLVWEGKLQVYKRIDDGDTLILGDINSGQWVGELQVLLGGNRTASVRAIAPTRLIQFSKPLVAQLTQQFPALNEYFVDIVRKRLREQQVTALLSSVFGELDPECLHELKARSQWVQISRGERLCARGEPGDSIYFVLNGRFNTVIENEGEPPRVLGQITRKEAIGELSVLTEEPRSASVYALRDSVLLRYDRDDFKALLECYPQVLMKVTQRIIERFKEREAETSKQTVSVETIAILARDRGAPLRSFSEQLTAALSTHGSLLYLNRDRLAELLDLPQAADLDPETPQGLRLQLWLEEQEERYRFIVFEADPVDSNWTQRCIRQADRLLWFARSHEDPSLTDLECQVRDRQTPATSIKETLVLLHPKTTKMPSGTRHWLQPRTLDFHHHIRENCQGDIERVARFLAGCAIGVALGGGGGRGAAHIGALKALEEAGVPIDFIGGTSIGSVMAGQYARGWDPETMLVRNIEGAKDNPFSAYTIPVVSLMNSDRLDRGLQDFFGDLDIEDVWLNFFCVSSNLSTGQKKIHRTGKLWKAVRASASMGGVFMPAIEDGELLIDGGTCDNDSSLTLRELHSGPIVLSAIIPQSKLNVPFTYEEFPSNWQLFWKQVNPFSEAIEFPGVVDLIAMAATFNSIRNSDRSYAAADLALAPPLEKYPVLDFKNFGEIAEVGYNYAVDRVKAWWRDRQFN